MARVNLGNGGVRSARRRRNHHYGGPNIRNVMPIRPKKPASAFNLFIRGYFRTPMARNFRSTSESMRNAGQYWRTNPHLHAQYAREVQTSRANFHRDLETYKRRRQLLKRPGNAYIYFLRDLWRTEGRGGTRTIREFGKYAGQTWRYMSQSERQPFIDRAIRAKATHNQMIRDLNAGITRVDDYLPPAEQARVGHQHAGYPDEQGN